MRISEYFNLGINQYGLDFVDVDPTQDTPLYLSPHVLSSRTDKWSNNANDTIRNFFQYVINQLQAGNNDAALDVFQHLSEPRETCLGQSRDGIDGAGVGNEYAEDILGSIQESRAVQTGLIEDLEDTIIFVEGVGKDRMSDITTNIIRKHLIDYTCTQCDLWDIEMRDDIAHGHIWNKNHRRWEPYRDRALIINDRIILLVPKSIVTRGRVFTPNRYYRLPVLDFIRDTYQDRTGNFLSKRKIRKNLYDYTDDIVEDDHYETLKEFLRSFTRSHPEVFRNFKSRSKSDEKPIENDEIIGHTPIDEIVDHLIEQLNDLEPGQDDADMFEKVTASIFELIFNPDLVCPKSQTRLNQGRKIVDITFTNSATRGIFERLHRVDDIPCSYIYIECKNYSGDPGNPEVDQLTGRFSIQNGRVGILACREIDDMDTMVQRCADSFVEGRGLIIPLSDEDLISMLDNIRTRYKEDRDLQAYSEIIEERVNRVRHRA